MQETENPSGKMNPPAQLDKIAASIPGLIFQFQLFPDGRMCFPYASAGIRDIYEVDPEAVVHDASPITDRLHPDDRRRVIYSIKESAVKGTIWSCEYRVVLPSKGLRWLRGESRPEKCADGSILWHGYINDITHIVKLDKQLKSERLRAEKELRESQQRLDMFFSQSLTGFFFMMIDQPIDWKAPGADKEALLDYVLDHQRMTKINQAMLDQYAAGEEQLLGASVRDLFGHNIAEGKQAWRELFDRGKLHIETDERKLDGTPMIIEGDYICLYDDAGRITGHFGVQREVTGEKEMMRRLEDSEVYHRTLINSIPDMFFVTDSDGTYLDFKADVSDLYVQADAFLGKTIPEVIPGEVGESFMSGIAAARRSNQVHELIYDLVINGERRFFQTRIAPYGQDKVLHFVRDITALKRTEQQLEEARTEAEQANVAKSRFLANMSHEIRTPLNSVIGFTDLLSRTRLNAEQQQYVEYANTAGKALLELISNVLDVSKIEAGRLELEPVRTDLAAVAGQVLRIVQHEADHKGITLKLHLPDEVPVRVMVDETRLRQVLLNLAGNAVKFTDCGEVELAVGYTPPPASGTRSVAAGELAAGYTPPQASGTRSVAAGDLAAGYTPPPASGTRSGAAGDLAAVTEKDTDAVSGDHRPMGTYHFSVRDTGIGIFADQRERLFRAFSQADTSISRKYGGTGLGLLISSSIVTAMGGNIALESVPGQGTTFRFDLQLPPWSESDTESESNADEVLPPHRSPSDNPVILIAEDMVVNMLLVRTLVEQSVEGVEILQAENGMQVLELLRRHRPDLVLMDVQMPQLDGLLATRGIREMEQGTGRRTPIVALSAGAMADERDRCIHAGMDDFLPKPLERAALQAILKRYVG